MISRRKTRSTPRRDPIHWQVVFFSCAALILGIGYTGIVEAAAPRNRLLPPGLDELPMGFLALLAVLWMVVGIAGIVLAAVVRRLVMAARVAVGIMFGCWAGAYTYGWIWADNETGFIAAGIYACIGLATITPPLWTAAQRGGR